MIYELEIVKIQIINTQKQDYMIKYKKGNKFICLKN